MNLERISNERGQQPIRCRRTCRVSRSHGARLALAFAFTQVTLLLAACSPGGPSGIAIEGVTVIDPIDGALPDRRVLVRNGVIVAVESMDTEPEEVAERIDGSGRFLIPGLWDMHVHFLYDQAMKPHMAGLFLDYGITSVRDTGGDLQEMLALLDGFEDSAEPEPNVYFSGPLLDGRFVVYDGGDPGRPKLGTGVPDPERAASVVAELKGAGADFIKIYELVSPDVYAALVGAAWRARLPIASHVPLMMTADDAGPLADSMEHLRNLELACAKGWEDLLATRRERISGFVEGRGYDLRSSLHKLQRVPAIEDYDEARCDAVLQTLTGTIQVPTLRLNTVAVRLPFNDPDWPRALAALPVPLQETWQAQADALRDGALVANPRFSEWSEFLIGRLRANGVPIGAGTDTPIGLGLPGWSLHTELEQLVAAGLSTREALLAATVVAASFLGKEEAVGRIQPGMTADLVLLEADPLADIRNTRRIERVMLGGRWVRQEAP